MTPKQLARLAMVLGALLLLWGAASLARRGSRGPSESDRFAIPAIAGDSADSVIITRPADTTRLVRRDSARWMVNGHPASQTAIQELFTALADTARRTELVAGRSASHSSLGVDSAKGARVRILQGDSTLAELVQGRRGPSLDGGYFRASRDSAVYLVGGNLAQVLERSQDEWRDRRMGGVTADSVARIEITRGKRSYAVHRDGAKWILGSGPADSAAIRALLADYRNVEAAGFATKAQADSARFARPDRRATLLRADGTPLVVLRFDSTANGFWVKTAQDSTVYRVDTWFADRLAPADTSLRTR